jgi:5-methylcytosine-specific restriction endonuclease McrA
MKKCSKCVKLKNDSEFSKDKSKKDGLQCVCKECQIEYGKENSEKKKEYNKEYRRKKAEKIKEYQKQYREKNAEQIIENRKKHYVENKEAILEKHREYKKINAEKIKERNKKYQKKYHKNNPEKSFNKTARRRAKIGDQGITKEEWLSVMNSTGWKCFYCDCSLIEKKVRTVDHIIPLSRGGKHCVDNLVPCCRKCNSSKHNKLFTEWDVITNLPEWKYEFLGKRIMDMICDT